jgi:predicted nucleic acid-binding protein
VTLFIDANIPMYVAGREHRFKSPSTLFLRRVAEGKVRAASDVEVLQEILYRYHHLREIEKGFVVFEAFAQAVPVIYPVLLEDALRAKELLRAHPGIKPRDALHAAVLRGRGLDTIVSYDRDFDRIPGIKRVEP